MNVEIVWPPAALAASCRMHWRAATATDAGVIGLAHRGDGVIEWVAPYHHLRVGGHVAKLIIDREPHGVTVVGLYRAR